MWAGLGRLQDKGAFYEGLRLKYLNRLRDAEEQMQHFAQANPKESVAYFELAKIAIQNKKVISYIINEE